MSTWFGSKSHFDWQSDLNSKRATEKENVVVLLLRLLGSGAATPVRHAHVAVSYFLHVRLPAELGFSQSCVTGGWGTDPAR